MQSNYPRGRRRAETEFLTASLAVKMNMEASTALAPPTENRQIHQVTQSESIKTDFFCYHLQNTVYVSYLVGSAAEPSIIDRATMPKHVGKFRFHVRSFPFTLHLHIVPNNNGLHCFLTVLHCLSSLCVETNTSEWRERETLDNIYREKGIEERKFKRKKRI